MLAALVTHLDRDTNRHPLARTPFRGRGFLCHTLWSLLQFAGACWILERGSLVRRQACSLVCLLIGTNLLVIEKLLPSVFWNHRVTKKFPPGL